MNPFSALSGPLSPLSAVPSFLAHRVETWSVESQHAARRNAMVATTALAERRAERQDVDAYFDSLRGAAGAPPLPAAGRR